MRLIIGCAGGLVLTLLSGCLWNSGPSQPELSWVNEMVPPPLPDSRPAIPPPINRLSGASQLEPEEAAKPPQAANSRTAPEPQLDPVTRPEIEDPNALGKNPPIHGSMSSTIGSDGYKESRLELSTDLIPDRLSLGAGYSAREWGGKNP